MSDCQGSSGVFGLRGTSDSHFAQTRRLAVGKAITFLHGLRVCSRGGLAEALAHGSTGSL
jgi:hypothetical protein